MLQPQAQSAQSAVINTREAWQCELYGDGPHCAGASNRVGNGPIAQAKYQQYQAALATYNSVAARLRAAQDAENAAQQAVQQSQGAALARYQAEARASLPGLQAQYSAVEAKLASMAKSDQNANNGNNGLLAQLSALWAASGQNFALVLAHLTVLALFFIIEILPVSVKFLLNLGAPTAYEIASKLREDKLIDSVRIQRTESRRREERESQARLSVEDDMRKREEDLGKRANEHVANHMEEILDIALAEWGQRVRARLAGHDPSVNGNGSSPNGQTRINLSPGLPADGGQL
jgi:hypothetical protein